MASKFITVTGNAMWAKVGESERDMFEWNDATGSFDKPSSTDGTYSISVEVEPSVFKEIRRSGSLSARFAKESESGLDVVRFKRAHEKKGKGGAVLDFASGPPKVVDDMGQPWDFATMGSIGNGSEVEVTFCVYPTAYSPGTRLEKVKVLNLVDREAPGGLEDAKADVDSTYDDEIPF